jgi:hypothetical protein
MGVLQEKVTKANWRDKTRETALFAHNIQQEEVRQKVIVFFQMVDINRVHFVSSFL